MDTLTQIEKIKQLVDALHAEVVSASEEEEDKGPELTVVGKLRQLYNEITLAL